MEKLTNEYLESLVTKKNEINVLKLHSTIHSLVIKRIKTYHSSVNEFIIDDVKVIVLSYILSAVKNNEILQVNQVLNKIGDTYNNLLSLASNKLLVDDYSIPDKGIRKDIRIIEFLSTLPKVDKINLIMFLYTKDSIKVAPPSTIRSYKKLQKLVSSHEHSNNTELGIIKYLSIMSMLDDYNPINKYLFMILGYENFNMLLLINEYNNLQLKVIDHEIFKTLVLKLYHDELKLSNIINDKYEGSIQQFLLTDYTESLYNKIDLLYQNLDNSTIDIKFIEKIQGLISSLTSTLISVSKP